MSKASTYSFLLASHPSQDFRSQIVQNILSLIGQGHAVYLYCLHDGIREVYTDEIQSLKKSGLHLLGCAYAAEKRALPVDGSAVFCGLGMLSDLLLHSDYFCSLESLKPIAYQKKSTHVIIGASDQVSSSSSSFEAVRVAAGLSATGQLRVILQLEGDGVSALFDAAWESLPDLASLWETCRENGVQVLTPNLSGNKRPPLPKIIEAVEIKNLHGLYPIRINL